MDQETKDFFKEEIGELAGMINKGFESLRTELRGEIVGFRDELKNDIGELRSELKEEINELREEVGGLRVITQRIDTRTQNQVDAVYEDTTILKTDMKAAKKDILSIKAHVGMTA